MRGKSQNFYLQKTAESLIKEKKTFGTWFMFPHVHPLYLRLCLVTYLNKKKYSNN